MLFINRNLFSVFPPNSLNRAYFSVYQNPKNTKAYKNVQNQKGKDQGQLKSFKNEVNHSKSTPKLPNQSKTSEKYPIHSKTSPIDEKQSIQSRSTEKQSLQSKTTEKESKTPIKPVPTKTAQRPSVTSKSPEKQTNDSKKPEKQTKTPENQAKTPQKTSKTPEKQPVLSKTPGNQSTLSKSPKKTSSTKTLKKSSKKKKTKLLKRPLPSKTPNNSQGVEENDDDMMEFELTITDALREYADGEPPEMQQNIAIAVLDTKQHFLENTKTMSGVEQAQYVHSLIEEKMKEDTIKNKDNISCKKGCNWCCQQMVFITSSEAELLVTRMKEKGIQPADIKHLRAQSLYGEENVDQFWSLSTEKSSCVFLKDGLCSVYEDRPSPCRTFQVSSHPSQCAKNGSGIIDKVISVGSEIISSAAIGMPNQKSGPLPRMVLEELEKQNLIQDE